MPFQPATPEQIEAYKRRKRIEARRQKEQKPKVGFQPMTPEQVEAYKKRKAKEKYNNSFVGKMERRADKFGRFLNEDIGGLIGTKQLGNLIGKQILEGRELVRDIKDYRKTGKVRDRKSMVTNEDFIKGIGGGAQLATLGLGGVAGAGAKTALGRLAVGAKTGAGVGATEGFASGLADTGKLSGALKRSAIGATIGAPIGAIPGGVSGIGMARKAMKARAGKITADKILPVANKSEIQKRAAQGLIETENRGLIGRTLLGNKSKIVATPEEQRIASTVNKYTKISPADNDPKLMNKISEASRGLVNRVRPELKRVRFDPNSVEPIRDKSKQQLNKYFSDPEFTGLENVIKKENERFLSFIDDIQKNGKDLNDLWELRIKFDKTVKNSIKNFDPSANPNTKKELLQQMWLDQRALLNDEFHNLAIGKVKSKEALSDLRDLIKASDNIKTRVNRNTLKPQEGLLSLPNLRRIGAQYGPAAIGGASGYFGLKALFD